MSTVPKRVLVAEDNLAMLVVVRFNLTRAGFDVQAAANGAEAARLFDDQSFDLVITDLQMPEMSGEELCRHIRRQAGPSTTAIIVCSAKGLEIDSARMMVDHELSHVLFKPFSPSELVKVVRRILQVHDECLITSGARC